MSYIKDELAQLMMESADWTGTEVVISPETEKQLQEADRLRKGKQTESKNTSIYLFMGLLAVALVLAYMNKK